MSIETGKLMQELEEAKYEAAKAQTILAVVLRKIGPLTVTKEDVAEPIPEGMGVELLENEEDGTFQFSIVTRAEVDTDGDS